MKSINLKSQLSLELARLYMEKLRELHQETRKKENIMATLKKHAVKLILDYNNSFKDILEEVNKYLEYRYSLIRKQVEGDPSSGLGRFIIETETPLTIGRSHDLGYFPFEISISFDSFLNTPYIQGSSLKGNLRHALYQILIKNEYLDKKLAELFCEFLFGGKIKRDEDKDLIQNYVHKISKNESIGGYFSMDNIRRLLNGHLSIIKVFDAYPVNNVDMILIPDIITPHYMMDIENELDVAPKPLQHFVINRGVRFGIDIIWNRPLMKLLYPIFGKNNDVSIIISWLKVAGWMGVGAKTSLGYSQYKVVGSE